jgi:hypothetical protein
MEAETRHHHKLLFRRVNATIPFVQVEVPKKTSKNVETAVPQSPPKNDKGKGRELTANSTPAKRKHNSLFDRNSTATRLRWTSSPESSPAREKNKNAKQSTVRGLSDSEENGETSANGGKDSRILDRERSLLRSIRLELGDEIYREALRISKESDQQDRRLLRTEGHDQQDRRLLRTEGHGTPASKGSTSRRQGGTVLVKSSIGNKLCCRKALLKQNQTFIFFPTAVTRIR